MISALRFGFGGHIEGSDPEPKPVESQEQSAAQNAAK
jgi:hypothetical protein